MSIADFFFGRKQNSTNSRKAKLNRKSVRTRNLRMEPLESRDLLSVTQGFIDDSAYAALRIQYPDFDLPEEKSTLKVWTVDLDEGATELKLEDLQTAISNAGESEEPDLILVKTTDDANTITYSSSEDELIINIDSTERGSITIVGYGAKPLTLDANQQCRVMTVDGENTVANLGGFTMTNGNSANSLANSNQGGGIYNSYGTLTITNSTVSENTASRSGGGVFNASGTLTIANSTISGNSASKNGGGINNDTGPLTITNCVFYGNSASEYGGGLHNHYDAVTITNSTIASNSAVINGSGISTYNGSITANNTIIAGNQVNNSIKDVFIVSNQGAISGSNSLSSFTGWTSGDDNIEYDSSIPLFNNAADGDYRILPKSQAINNGSNTFAADAGLTEDSADVYGNPRFVGAIDIGASEFQDDITYSTEVTTLDDSFDLYDDEWSLREAIYYSSLISSTDYPTITFSEGLEGQINLTQGQLEIANALVIDGDNRITIDAGQNSRVFYVSAGTEETPVVLNGLTIQNGADTHGGGIVNTGFLNVTDSKISGNTALWSGGGICNFGTISVINSVLTENTASNSGGGIHNDNGTATITNCTIWGNASLGESTDYNGGGISLYHNSNITINNSIIAGNTAHNSGNDISDLHGLSVISGSNNLSSFTGWTSGSSNIKYNAKLPLFVDAANGDYHLILSSQAIDKGSNQYAGSAGLDEDSTDVSGSPRFVNDTIDIGAYEFQNEYSYSTEVNTLNDSFDLNDEEWSLREAIYYAPGYVEITFSDDLNGKITLSDGQLEIIQPMSIDGDNRIILDGDNASRVFYVSAGTEETPVVLTGLTIQNGSADQGGGIYSNIGAVITVTGCTISNNTATNSEGGLGGGIANKGTLTVNDSIISGNAATGSENVWGGGIYNEGTLTITNSEISQNSSTTTGGGIFNDTSTASLTISNSKISNNSADWAGGIYSRSSSLIVTNSIISGNEAGTRGGGIRVIDCNATITNSSITGNTASYGGGICVTNSINLYNTIIATNTASVSGNDIDFFDYTNSGSVSGSNNLSSFTGWTSGSNNLEYNTKLPLFVDAEHGDYHLILSSQTIDKGSNQYADDAGLDEDSTDLSGSPRFVNDIIDIGAYEYQNEYAYSSVVNTLNDSFDLNDEEWSLREAIYYAPGYVEITFRDDLNGTITLSDGQLEIVQPMSIDGNKRITIDGDNASRVFYVSVGTEETPVVLTGLTIQNGYADYAGGGIFNTGALTITNSTITNNAAYHDGGGIDNHNSTASLTIENCVISNNTAIYGGGIHNFYGALTIADSEISDNTVTEYGGGIHNYSDLTLTNTTISGNSAKSGGGINNNINEAYNDVVPVLNLLGCTVSGNTASDLGGGLLSSGAYGDAAIMNVTDCVVSDNEARVGGGIFNGVNSTMTSVNSSFTDNSASEMGGAIYNNTNLTVSDSVIFGNSAQVGGGIQNMSGTVSITNSRISGNSAENSGGGINNNTGPLAVTNSVFYGNSASEYGGALHNHNGNVTITNSTIALNSASINGCGISTYTGSIAAYNTIIAGNPTENSTNDVVIVSNKGAISGSNNLSTYVGWTSGSNNLVYDSSLPLFVDAANGDYHLATGSQAINKGSNALAVNASGQAIARDLDNLTRIMYNTVDIGAYEYRDLPAPALSAEMTGIDSIKVTVGEVTNATGYTLEYSTSEDFADAVSLDVSAGYTSVTGLSVNTTYYFRAMALGEGDYTDSEFSESASATTDRIQVSAPTLTAVTTSSYSIAVTVGEVENASGYTVEYSTSEDFANATSQNVSVGETTIADLNANRTYYFRVIALGEGDYRDSEFSESVFATTDRITLTAPTLNSSVKKATATYTWDEVPNASGYQFEYKAVDAEDWIVEEVAGTSFSFEGEQDVTYTARVKALGVGDYTDSGYSNEQGAYINGAQVTINGKKVTVSWVDDSPAADSIRYRAVNATKWTTKKLKAGVTEFKFNGALGTEYEIEVLLDQQEVKVYNASAVVLDQPKLKADKAFLKDDTFQIQVTNFAAKNLATNATQAIVTVNGVQTKFDIENQEGFAELENGGIVAFANGLFTFTEMKPVTQYKVQIAFSDGYSDSTASSALSVKTTKAPYLTPVITSAAAVSDTSIVVEWETAYGKGTETPAQKYTVQYSLDGNKWSNATTGATGNSYTIQKLKGGNEYKVRVLASKDNAFEASAPSEFETAETLAAPKTTLEKNSVTDGEFQLNVTNYQTANLDKATTINVKSDQCGETAINLENGEGSTAFENGMTVAFNNGVLTFAKAPSATQQKILVNFSDGVCTTAWSQALTVKTAIASYSKPEITSAVADGTSIDLEWSTSYGKNTEIEAQSYTIQYSINGAGRTNVSVVVVGTSYTITGLMPGTQYHISVTANKDARFNASQPSDIEIVPVL